MSAKQNNRNRNSSAQQPSGAQPSTTGAQPSTDAQQQALPSADDLRYVLTQPRYVSHADRWTRNRPSSALVLGLADDTLTIERKDNPDERGEREDAPAVPDDQRTPDTLRSESGSTIVRIDCRAIRSADDVRSLLGCVLGALGMDWTTPEAAAIDAARKSKAAQRKIRAAHEPSLTDVLDTFRNSARLPVAVQHCTQPQPGTLAHKMTGGAPPIAYAAKLAHEAGLDPSDALRAAYSAARAAAAAQPDEDIRALLLGGLDAFAAALGLDGKPSPNKQPAIA